MEIMLSHLGISMAYDALDGLNIHAQRLHLRHIGVAAAVRREQADIARFFQRFAEYIPEMGGIAGQAGLGAFPDELVGDIPQLDGARADIQRHRNIPDRSILLYPYAFSGTVSSIFPSAVPLTVICPAAMLWISSTQGSLKNIAQNARLFHDECSKL